VLLLVVWVITERAEFREWLLRTLNCFILVQHVV
jgi:hypothetical protein